MVSERQCRLTTNLIYEAIVCNAQEHEKPILKCATEQAPDSHVAVQ